MCGKRVLSPKLRDLIQAMPAEAEGRPDCVEWMLTVKGSSQSSTDRTVPRDLVEVAGWDVTQGTSPLTVLAVCVFPVAFSEGLRKQSVICDAAGSGGLLSEFAYCQFRLCAMAGLLDNCRQLKKAILGALESGITYSYQAGKACVGWTERLDTDIHTPPYTKQTTNENLLRSTGSPTECSVVTWMGRKSKSACMYTYNQFTLLHSRNQHNTAKQPHFNKIN